jgi:type IX secretion system PorP/SprF family membrane protein
MGIKAGMSSYSVDYGKLNIENPNEIYSSNEKTTWSNYNVGMGFYLYNEKYYLGLSIPNLLKNNFFDIYNNTQANSTPNYYLTSGYKFEIERDIYLTPSILTRIVKGSPLNTLFASTIDWEEKFYGSLNIDLNSTFGGFAGFRFDEKYMIGYSYDSSINNFSNSNGGIHSFFLNIRLENNWSREKCGCYSF